MGCGLVEGMRFSSLKDMGRDRKLEEVYVLTQTDWLREIAKCP